MKRIIEQEGKDMIYLLQCALHKEAPAAERVEKMNLSRLYEYSCWHAVVAMTYDALELMEKMPQHEVMKAWRDKRDKAIRKNMLFDAERGKLFDFMESKGIWYMPLKGVVLKELYPRAEMRQMSDNDILFDKTFRDDIYNFFTERGYESKKYTFGNHDVYKKNPVYNYEMHVSLFDEYHNTERNYYSDVKERLVKDEGNNYGYHFNDEDFYIYFIAHTYKHYSSSGTGIRSFIDDYVFQSNKKLDWEYIDRELEKLEMLEFGRGFRTISMKLFGDCVKVEALGREEYDFVAEGIGSGTYGTIDNQIDKKLQKIQGNNGKITHGTKFKYIFMKLFPGKTYLRVHAPFVYKTKVLIPFYYVYRLIRGVTVKRKKTMGELKKVVRK